MADYQKYNDLYVFCDCNGNEAEDGLDKAATQTKTIQDNNEKNFCLKCRRQDPTWYATCEIRDKVAKETHISFGLYQNTTHGYIRCPQCGVPVRIWTGGEYKSVILQDLRMGGTTTKLLINWRRAKCPSCNIFVGREKLHGIEAFIDGKMTCRLAEYVLKAHLSGITRAHIQEAYGLSSGQIDRLRKRLIQEKRRITARAMRSTILQERDASVEVFSFPISKTNIDYYAYFWVKQDQRIQLINLLSSTEREILSNLSNNSEDWKAEFSDADQFFLSCYCILAGERGLKGEELESRLKLYDALYRGETDYDSDQQTNHLILYRMIHDNRIDKTTLRLATEQLRLELQLDTTRVWRYLPQYKSLFDALNGGQLLMKEYVEQIFGITDDQYETYRRLFEFVHSLVSSLANEKVKPEQLKDTLLWANPAMVTQTELSYYSGKLFYGEIDFSELGSEVEYMFESIVGPPIECLLHYIRSGTIQQISDQLLCCPVIRGKTLPSKMKTLPCGTPRERCPNIYMKDWNSAEQEY